MGVSGYKKIKKMRIFLYFILILLLKKKKQLGGVEGDRQESLTSHAWQGEVHGKSVRVIMHVQN